MQRPSEERLAKAAYNWLRISPVVTIPTLLFIVGMNIASTFCLEYGLNVCNSQTSDAINYTFGVLGSALWHLVLLQYANNKDSGFVRKHGQQAAIYAGIRTAIPLGGVILSYFAGASIMLICLVVGLLVILWLALPNMGMAQIKKDLAVDSEITRDETLPRPAQGTPLQSHQVVSIEADMSDPNKQNPEEILNEVLSGLKSTKVEDRAEAMRRLSDLNFSSEAIRRELEIIASSDENKYNRANALAALNLPSNRMVQKRSNANRLDRGTRYVILQEINEWVRANLLDSQNADLIRRRYDFDFEPSTAAQTPPAPVPVQAAEAKAEAKPAGTQPAVPLERREPEGPRPSLLQTLTSEAAIRIYLYLGAFFVIAAATFVGWAIPEFRLPILLFGTFAFGMLSVAIKKRLPQPSFALFIVFSFLLIITANNIEDTLRTAMELSSTFSAGYWVVVFLLMAGLWGGSTWLYQSRLFSITAFGSLVLSLYRIGDLFNAKPEFYTSMVGVAALAGLGGVWLVKKWKDEKFALPLFFAAQAVQGVTLISSISIFGVNIVDPSNPALWHLAAFTTWGLTCAFFILSNALYPFFAFPWLAAGALIPMPWFIAAAFDLESLGSTIVLMLWGAVLAIASEILHKFEAARKYSLPVLLASIPAFGLGLITGFTHGTWLGMVAALGIALIYAALHLLRNRWWLWTIALLNFVFAYFAFFNLETIQRLDIFIGHPLLGITILFLLPDLLLKKDWQDVPVWRLPPRIYGALFTAYTSLILLIQDKTGHVAAIYAVMTVFFAIYALLYRNPLLGYLPAAYLPLAVFFALDAFDLDAWLPALTVLAVLYFAFGIAIRAREGWSFTLRNSALILGAVVSFATLLQMKETGGWYALVVGLLFLAEMYLRKNGLFEPGAPIFFTIGAFLILRDLDVQRVTHHLLAYSLVWILTDLLAHLTFPQRHSLSIATRAIGGFLALVNYGFLFADGSASVAAFGFAIYTLLALTVSLVYRRPNLFYAFTLTLPLFVTFLFRIFDVTKWIHPVIVLAVLYYAAGFLLRARNRAEGWDKVLLYSGLGVGTFVSIASPALGGLDAAIPVAIAATLWAVEAFAKRNAWLAFPANGLYLLAYFILLGELNVDEPQFYSIGAALLGLVQHYLLTRAGSRPGAFIMGMLSQFVLLGTTYIQMIVVIPVPEMFRYFVLLFFQSLAVLAYGIVIRSRSLTLFPIGFVVLGVITLSFLATGGLGTVFIVGCTGILLLGLGILAVLMRERLAKLGERMSDWKP
ncbi:MAG: hypothetical protein QY328_10255 [Anaerolineales bacterium]|nr:MAG: hypothetical protein QY328_10255 [Anaerolineales bacterium]